MTLCKGRKCFRVPLLLQGSRQSRVDRCRRRIDDGPELGIGQKLRYCTHSCRNHRSAGGERLQDYVGPSLFATCEAAHIGSAEVSPKLIVGHRANELTDISTIQLLRQLLKAP